MRLGKIVIPGLLIFFQFVFNFLVAQPANYRTPAAEVTRMFYLQRSHNENTISYDINVLNGKLNVEDPIHVYWIRYQENGQKAELSFIQRKFAYGITAKKIKENYYELSFVSYKKQKLYLMPGADGKYHIYTSINKKLSILNKIYLEIKGGTFWLPNIEYVEITGTDPATNQVVKEKIKI